MVKVGLVILARLDSSRLPKKHLKEIGNGLTVIEWLITRIDAWILERNQNNKDLQYQIILATSLNTENQAFEFLKGKYGNVEVFYGDDGNIPRRIQQVAEYYQLSRVIAYGGDNPLTSMEATELVDNALHEGADYVETVGLPIGLNSFGFQVECLNRALNNQSYADQSDLEFGWNLIIQKVAHNSSTLECSLRQIGSKDLRVTLDYQQDLEFFRAVFNQVFDSQVNQKILDEELIEGIIERNLYQINGDLSKEYWERFNQGVKRTID